MWLWTETYPLPRPQALPRLPREALGRFRPHLASMDLPLPTNPSGLPGLAAATTGSNKHLKMFKKILFT